jgi:hypothetical protein
VRALRGQVIIGNSSTFNSQTREQIVPPNSMVLVRDPAGLVSQVRVDSTRNNYWDDPKFGETRRAYRYFLDEERKNRARADAALNTIGQYIVQSPSSKLEIGLEDQLLVEEHGQSESQDTECANSRYRPGMWVQLLRKDLDTMLDPESPFLNRLGHFCLQAQIQPCRYRECLKNRKPIDKIAPTCKWPRFREWAVTLISCQASCTVEQRLLQPHIHLSGTAGACHTLLDGYTRERKRMTSEMFNKNGKEITVDAFGVCEIIYWMLIVQSSISLSHVIEGRWEPDFLQLSIATPAIKRALRGA